MKQALLLIQRRLFIVTFVSFALAPMIGYATASFFDMVKLKSLSVDKLKIDGTFVHSLDTSKDDRAMVQSMNQIAHAIGKQTIAEFVQNEKTLNILRDYSVDFAQRHYLGKPQPTIDTKKSLFIIQIIKSFTTNHLSVVAPQGHFLTLFRAPTASIFLLLVQKKGSKEKDTQRLVGIFNSLRLKYVNNTSYL